MNDSKFISQSMLCGQRIKEVRLNRGLSLAAFGEKIGYSSSSVMRYEKADRSPELKALVNISNVFNVDFNWLIGDDVKASENELIRLYNSLSPEEQNEVMRFVLFVKGRENK